MNRIFRNIARHDGLQGVMLCLLLTTLPALALQAEPADLVREADLAGPEQEIKPVALPGIAGLAGALSDPKMRYKALLDLAAVARLQMRLDAQTTLNYELEIQQLVNDRAWLDGLVNRYGSFNSRSPVMDPAAWRVHLELDAQRLQVSSLVAPTGPALEIYLDQVFNRQSGRLSSVMLPELVWLLETHATIIWKSFLQRAESDELLTQAMLSIAPALLMAWYTDPASKPAKAGDKLLAEMAVSLAVLARASTLPGPPDARRLADIRYQLLLAMPALTAAQQSTGEGLLHLAELLNGLSEHRYVSFAEGLLAIMTQLAFIPPQEQNAMHVLPGWLVAQLPALSSAYARAFAGVDPRLNSAVAAVFDVARELAKPGEDGFNADLVQKQLADAVAQLALQIPDMAYYFDLPVRDPIAGGVDACTGIAQLREADGSPAMTRQVFDDCQETLVGLADKEAREAQLAGSPKGPYGTQQLERELSVTSGQRINYGIGYLHNRYATGCEQPDRPLPNPLEWSYLASMMSWFADQSPVYFQTPENEQRLLRMREIGAELMRVMGEQVDCIAGAGASLNDPIVRTMVEYRQHMAALNMGLRENEAQFRQQFLAPGADVKLDSGVGQSTAYRPEGMIIGPCDPANVCEMTAGLSSTRALQGLFPDEFLIADQTGLGKLEICYDQVEWVNRRSKAVREDDKNVANYYGRLAFDLKGRYLSQDEPQDIFGFRFTSPEESHYLFGSAADEVLEDSCPVEWIGTRIVSPMPSGSTGIVPNRLTYLSAPRAQPSRLLAQNWDKGAEWRDWFVTGIGVEALAVESPVDIRARVNQHLGTLYRLQQESIYGSLLQTTMRGSPQPLKSLNADAAALTTSKSLIRMQMMLFYPQILNESDQLRSGLSGQNGLVDALVLTRFREEGVPVAAINSIALERLEQFNRTWQMQAEALRRLGSIPSRLAHTLMRLNALYIRYFLSPVPTATELQISPPTPEQLDD